MKLAASSVKSQYQKARHCLVIGPGAGEELKLLLQVLPKAQFTLVEPSEQMRSFCMKELEKINATARCSWIPSSLTKARGRGVTAKSFDAVIALNLMHLFPPAEQIEAFDQLSSLVAPGGAMLLSSYSEDQNKLSNDLIVSIATERLRIRGLNEEQIKMVLSARNQSISIFF
ncbi:class I SAM-dependent methyltransferase [Prochlorococcus marinus]|uniref:class I SAM-dependent methyltransferase n=1 Tax=Prochlorococcus marinus TaxID=1219 RepID=UPI0007B36726|nr:class I SAM-dependent methyltransferase [Prochlorococcus marinus]